MEIIIILLLLVVGFIAGIMGVILGGGGGFISIPLLTFFGLSPAMAIATNRFGTLGEGFFSTLEFIKAKQVNYKYTFILSLTAIVASILGSIMLIKINEKLLAIAIAIIMLVLLPLIFVKNNVGIKKINVKKWMIYLGIFVYFLVGIYDAFVGIGGGLVAVYTLTCLMGMTFLQANATDKIPWVVNTIISTIIYAVNGLVNYKLGIILLIGMSFGGYTGARIAIIKGNRFLRIMFAIAVILFAAKMLYDVF